MTRRSSLTPAAVSLAAAFMLVCTAATGQAQPRATLSGDRERLFAHFELVGEVDLKRLYLRCAREASQRLLGFDEAAHCVVAGEVLKARSFGGDFNALLAWWRQHRDDRLDEPSHAVAPVVEALRPLP